MHDPNELESLERGRRGPEDYDKARMVFWCGVLVGGLLLLSFLFGLIF